MDKIYYLLVIWYQIGKIPHASSQNDFHPNNDLDFCATKCGAKQEIVHVACTCHGKDSSNRDCHVPEDITKNIVAFRQHCLTVHNEYRNQIALGKDKMADTLTGPAANMNILSYDIGLEYTAGCNANQCKMEPDYCSITKLFPQVGQNLYTMMGTTVYTAKDIVNFGVKKWFNEEEQLKDETVIDSFDGEKSDQGIIVHFTQVVWATATHLGCMITKNEKTKSIFLTCNYGSVYKDPKLHIQNLKGFPVYLRGMPASRCIGEKKKNHKYPGLCGDQEKIPTFKTGYSGTRLSAGFWCYFMFFSAFVGIFLVGAKFAYK